MERILYRVITHIDSNKKTISQSENLSILLLFQLRKSIEMYLLKYTNVGKQFCHFSVNSTYW